MSGFKKSNSAEPSSPSRRERFFASYCWLILKNLMGWLLILAAFVTGPLVPGPGGIPLFLIGFALISFPGKRRLTARVLRGKPMRFQREPFRLVSISIALALPALTLAIARMWSGWSAGEQSRGPFAMALLYLLCAVITWSLVRLSPHGLNLVLRIVAKARRRVRPWLRHHGIRLLPPRRRRRRSHEPGSGPFRLKDEILRFTKIRG